LAIAAKTGAGRVGHRRAGQIGAHNAPGQRRKGLQIRIAKGWPLSEALISRSAESCAS
jgi:hypothetical protein